MVEWCKEVHHFFQFQTTCTKASCFQRIFLVVSLFSFITTPTFVAVTSFTTAPCRNRKQMQKMAHSAIEAQNVPYRKNRGNKNQNVESNIITFPIHTNVTIIHQYFMKRALHQAQLASHVYSEVPIGAIVVRNLTTYPNTTATTTTATNDSTPKRHQHEQAYEILSEQHNRVEMNYDASAHAEMLALRDAAQNIQNWRLNCDTNQNDNENNNNSRNGQSLLYCTLEPCMMCYAAAHAFRIQQIVYGAPDIRLGACGSYVNMIEITSTSSSKHPYHTISNITSGIYATESSSLLRHFFRQRRLQQSSPQNQLPLPKRKQLQQAAVSDLSTSLKSTAKPLPFYRRLWRRWIIRIR